MPITDVLSKRRSYYQLNKELPIKVSELKKLVEDVTSLVPDAFNMQSAKVVVALGEKQDKLWDAIYEAFGGKVPRDRIDGFKAAAGTILYFYDTAIIENHQKQFPRFSENFPVWAEQANGMLQINMWSALRELGIGASLQHYNPVIDRIVKDMFNVPESWKLRAQMPFGGIVAEPEEKPKQDISTRVRFVD